VPELARVEGLLQQSVRICKVLGEIPLCYRTIPQSKIYDF